MKILAIETSCDDTGIAILDNEKVIVSLVHSQIEQHSKFGGVIPELASRLHQENIFTMIKQALSKAKLNINEIDKIAVTQGPGLINTLQVGLVVAKTLSQKYNIDLIPINHMEAHIYSPFIGKKLKQIPAKSIVLIVSGGHTQIVIKDKSKLKLIGETKDDSIGEAFDKVAKYIGLNYPGGPKIDKIFKQNPNFKVINVPKISFDNFDFSYSGLKTFFINQANNKKLDNVSIACNFQLSAIQQVIDVANKAINKYKINNLIVVGGVAANSLLKAKVEEMNCNYYFPLKEFTTDNAGMIGYAAYVKIINKETKKVKLDIDSIPNMRF